jgi:hypothetical protein
MHSFAPRVGRWPLVLTLAALCACLDQPEAVGPSSTSAPRFSMTGAPMVTNTSGANTPGSLQWAAEVALNGETVTFDPSLAGATIVLDSALTIWNDITIEAPATRGVTIKATGGGPAVYTRALANGPNGTITLRNFAITGGFGPRWIAGGVYNTRGTLVLDHVTVHDNHTESPAITSYANLTLINSTVSGNSSPTDAAAIEQRRGTLTLVNTTVANNATGGINVYTDSATLVLRNSLLATNGLRNCFSLTGITYEGQNLATDITCGDRTKMLVDDPKLDVLRDNGGPTSTHATLGGAGVNAGRTCTVTVDQRYAPRDSVCDIGAYELTDLTKVTVTINDGVMVDQRNGWAVLTGTVTCTRDESFSLAVELHQQQKVRGTPTDIHAASTTPVTCSTVARPWSALMVLSSGAFENGSGQASAQTYLTPGWVSPASASKAVKLYWGHR